VGKNKDIRGNGAVHHSLGQARHSVEQHLLLPARCGHRVAAVGHAACCGGNHGKHAHAHGGRIVRDTMLVAVAHGRDGILAGDNFFPDFTGFFWRHVKLGAVLPGKRHPKRIFSHCAAAQGQQQARPGPALHFRDGFGNFPLQIWRQRRTEYGLLQRSGKAEDFLKAVHVCGLNTAVQLAAQPVVFHKAVIGAHSHGKAVGHIQPGVGRHLAQIGHFAAHQGNMAQADIAQRHDAGAVLQRLFFKQALHLPADAVKRLLQRLVLVVGQCVEVAHHLKNSRHNAGACGMHVIHAKRTRAGEMLFHIAHGLKRGLVGRQQTAKARAPLAQAGLKGLLARKLFRIRLVRAITPQQFPQAVEQRHVYIADRAASSILMISSLMATGLSM